jgi:poly(3-hydroxybutyrate) depolymerase
MINKLVVMLISSILLLSSSFSQEKRQRPSKDAKQKKEKAVNPNAAKVFTAENGILKSGTFHIRQSWSEETDYDRPVHVKVPEGEGPFPVSIMLHGRGGTGARKLQSQRGMTDRIIIAPDGYNKGWSAQRPDVDFIRQIIKYIKTCKVTDGSNIAIHGASNGAGLLNQLMIELEADTFHYGISSIGGLGPDRHDGTNFLWDPTGKANFDTPITPAKGRKWLQINGTEDKIIPYKGGKSTLGFKVLPAQDTFYAWAVHMGEKGPKLPDSAGKAHPTNEKLIIYKYLNGNFIHVKGVGSGHGVRAKELKTIVKDFLSQPPMKN